jgi:GNAT superfamily N-acetyltransferase
MRVRHATRDDIAAIVSMAERVQAKLTAAGSLQVFGPLPVALVAAHVAAATAYVLGDDRDGRLLGGVFVAPVTGASHPALRRWGLAELAGTTYFLEKLMIEPGEQGHGLGYALLAGVGSLVLAGPDDTIVLDCWSGNDTLRAFYARAGFHLHGVFPAGTPANAFEVAVFLSYREFGPEGSV